MLPAAVGAPGNGITHMRLGAGLRKAKTPNPTRQGFFTTK